MVKLKNYLTTILFASLALTTSVHTTETKITFCEKIVRNNNVELWTESFGKSTDSPILLICGAGSHCITFSDEFCEALTKKGMYVIRFDNRDIGKSTLIEYEKNPYSLDDMALDAVTILNEYKIPKAHIVGHSMGGFIGQLIAINHPERIISLVSMMSSPDQSVTMAAVMGKETSCFALPPPDPHALKIWQELKEKPALTREDIIDNMTISLKLTAGKVGYNEQEIREHQEKVFDRTKDFKAVFNHWSAMSASPGRIDRLKTVKVPTLVIHGGSDVVLPQEHGIATAKSIPNSKITIIPEMGHIICRHYHEHLVSLIAEHVANNK